MRTEEKILHHLSRHPRLTAEQIARVAYENQKTHLKASGQQKPNSLSSANSLLNRMLKKKLVKMWKRDHPNESNLWMLPKTPGIRPTKYYHIKALGDLYVAYGTQ